MTGAIDTLEVLAAAGSKWNFLSFFQQTFALSLSKTGHCIGVDPYYLTHKAQEIGYHPEVILAGRRINDSMAGYVADEVVKLMTRRKMQVVDSRILVLGLTFKEGCPDLRNTKVIDVVRELAGFHAKVDIYDTEWISFLPVAVPPRSRRTFVELLIGCMLNPEGWVTRAIGAIRREAHWNPISPSSRPSCSIPSGPASGRESVRARGNESGYHCMKRQ